MQEYSKDHIRQYEFASYNKKQYTGELFAEDLCVASEDVSLDGVEADPGFHGEGLFNIADSQIKYGYKLFDKLYPASTTKLMTLLVAIENSSPKDCLSCFKIWKFG